MCPAWLAITAGGVATVRFMSDDPRPDLSDWDFVAAMPKVELHVHLEGTIAPTTQLAIAERNGVELPYNTPEGVAEYQAKQRATGRENLVNFLDCLDISRGVLRTPEDFHTITMEFLARCRDERVVYVEMMFDPQQAMRQGLPLGDCVEAIAHGQHAGETDYGVESKLIMSFQRDHPAEEALSILDAAEDHRHLIVGIGLDNYETPGFPSMFLPAYEAARSKGYRLTSHCDVNQPDSAQHIRECVELLGVERIDHGLNAADDPQLIDLIGDHDIALTACPTFYTGESSSAPRTVGDDQGSARRRRSDLTEHRRPCTVRKRLAHEHAELCNDGSSVHSIGASRLHAERDRQLLVRRCASFATRISPV